MRPILESTGATHEELQPRIVWLGTPSSRAIPLVGAKAASLARSMEAGLPVLPGFVLTTAVDLSFLRSAADGTGDVHAAWRELTHEGRVPLVVRSSATKEDGESSSMAGLFVSKLDVVGWDAFVAAVMEVLASKDGVDAGDVEMAVLVQPFLRPRWGGVLFGADPVTERTDRLVVTAVPGGPDGVVSGQVDGWQATLTRRGRVVEATDGAHPKQSDLQELSKLARRLESINSQPQDIEWAIDEQGLRLLQSRPITTLHGPVSGPVYGTGPLAETFPDPLAPLEESLWLDPLRDGLRHALGLLGTSAAGRLQRAPLVVSIGGRPAVDLGLLGAAPRRRSILRALDPRPRVRRLRAAWRVGRLSMALPDLARDLIGEVDRHLLAVPTMDGLTDNELVRILRNSAPTLRALHAYEALAGALLRSDPTVGAAGVALEALGAEGDDRLGTTADVIARTPILLALIPPRIPPTDALPPTPPHVSVSNAVAEPTLEGLTREALRLRIRWVHELTARAASELGARLAQAQLLPDPAAVRYLRADELRAMLSSRQPFHPNGRPDAMRRSELPTEFRLAADGTPVDVGGDRRGEGTGTPVGGGRGRGVVSVDPAEAGAGIVLVVRSLDPGLAGVIPQLAGLVAETGSPLSHLAILAREHGVPTVVGRSGALAALRAGDVVEVDGSTGAVSHVEPTGAWAGGSR